MNLLGLNVAMCCSQASCYVLFFALKMYMESESALFVGTHVKAPVIGAC